MIILKESKVYLVRERWDVILKNAELIHIIFSDNIGPICQNLQIEVSLYLVNIYKHSSSFDSWMVWLPDQP